MPTSTEVAIATTTLSSAASSIDFTSIPNTYTDLRLVFVLKPSGNAAIYIKLNNDSSSTYSWTQISGNGTTAASARGTDTAGLVVGGSIAFNSAEWQMGTVDIFSYTGSTYKTSFSSFIGDRNGAGTVAHNVALYPSTSVINRLTIINQASRTFAAGTTATLYGIL